MTKCKHRVGSANSLQYLIMALAYVDMSSVIEAQVKKTTIHQINKKKLCDTANFFRNKTFCDLVAKYLEVSQTTQIVRTFNESFISEMLSEILHAAKAKNEINEL